MSHLRTRAGRVGGIAALFLAAASLLAQRAATDGPPDGPAPPAETASAGYFSPAQVERGAAAYGEQCSECHTTSQFRGPEFEWRWRRQTAWELFEEISKTMPESDPGGLDPDTYAAIVAYLLSLNEYRAGDRDLAATETAMRQIALGAGAAKQPSP